MLALILILFIIIFYGSFFIGESLSKKKKSVFNLGKKTYSNKIRALESSVLFSPLRIAIKLNSHVRALVFIFPLILLKSILFGMISIFLIAPLFIIVQGIAMGSLVHYYDQNVGASKELRVITFWQLLSHIIAATVGTSIGLKWLYYQEAEFNISLLLNSVYATFYILIVLTTIIAAYLESKSLITNKNY